MADAFKVLGQVNPVAGVLSTLYTVPGATSATVSSIVVANSSSVADKFRVSVAIAGAADTTAQYLYYDVTIPAYNTFVLTIGITLGVSDVVRIYAGSSFLSFNAFGVEVS